MLRIRLSQATDSTGKPADAIAAGSERFDGFERKDAVGATTIGDHITAFRKLAQSSFQFGERNVQSPREVAKREFVFGAHV